MLTVRAGGGAEMAENREKIAQTLIVSAPSQTEAIAKAKSLAAAALCSGSGKKPCGLCRDCRKAASGVHPDLITVRRLTDDKGRLKREITVDQIRAMAADAVVLPNEAARKVYLIEDADKMNTQAQNAALKLFEEPPAAACFLLCVTNAALLLPTVRSRCETVRAGGGEAETDEAARTLAEGYLKALGSGERSELLRWCMANEGIDGRQAAAFAEAARGLIADALCARRENPGLTERQLLLAAELLARCADYLRVNVGVKHIFGLLAVDSPVGGEQRSST